MSELETFLETPEVVADQNDAAAVATADATPDTTTTEGKGDKDAATPAAVTDATTAKTGAEKHWSESAYHDEKRKRQALEQQLQQYQKPAAKQEEVDLFVDPKGFTEGLKNELKNGLRDERISLSREFLMESKPDYADKEARFVQMVAADDSLRLKMNAHPNPAKFAYETAAKAMADEAKLKLLDGVGDIDALREKFRQEFLAEQNGTSPPAAKPVKPIVEKAPSLATASAAKSNTTPTDASLVEMFPR